MRFFSALSVLGLAAAAAAAPAPSAVSTELQESAVTANDGWDIPTKLQDSAATTDDEWDVSSNDTWVTATKRDRINWGDIPPWWVADKLNDNCDSSGCHAEFKSGTTILDSNISKRRVDVTVDTGPTDYEVWVKRGLIQLMNKAMQVEGIYETKRKQPYLPSCIGFMCQTSKAEFYDQYIGPRRIKVEYQNPKGLRMSTLQIDVRNEATSGEACKKTAQVLGALAGVANSFGGLFALAEIFSIAGVAGILDTVMKLSVAISRLKHDYEYELVDGDLNVARAHALLAN
ncbi:hypothetical protein V493_03127 [Pseudogymnoascus sp. VKM F-4281 (FW-2241)]|nr:hypothetical protein V493_03127 [Pseudogymnoascus sp. VKM F-4281 (FW-2241)]